MPSHQSTVPHAPDHRRSRRLRPRRDSRRDAAVNAEIIRRLNAEPEGLTIQEVRARRLQGLGAFPLPPFSQRAESVAIEGPAGTINLRVIAPKSPRGIFFHIHGGGWCLGAPELNDPLLESIADGANVACVSTRYRLAPEHPYPAGPDDCEAAALWVVREGVKRFGTSKLAIGGESAGAHLSAVTLLRLRDRHKLTPFGSALLNYGCFDLAMTPSVRRWGTEKLVLNTAGVTAFCNFFVPQGVAARTPTCRRSTRTSRACRRRCSRSARAICCSTTRCSWRRAGSRPATWSSSRSIPAPATASPACRSRSVTRLSRG